VRRLAVSLALVSCATLAGAPVHAASADAAFAFRFDLPAAAPACSPQPGGVATAWLFRGETETMTLVFDSGLVLLRQPDGRLDDDGGEFRSGGPVGALALAGDGAGATLTLVAPGAGCSPLQHTGTRIAAADTERPQALAEAWQLLLAAERDARRGQFATALAGADRAVQLRAHRLGADHALALMAEHRRLGVLAAAGRSADVLAGAEALLQRAASHPSQRLRFTLESGYTRAQVGRGLAAQVLTRAQRLVVEAALHLGDDDPLMVALHSDLGRGYRDTQRFEESIRVYERNVAVLSRTEAPDSRARLTAEVLLAGAMQEAGQLDEAAARQESLVAHTAARFGPDDELSQLALSNLASTHDQLKNFDRGFELFRQLHATRARTLGERHPRTLFAKRAVAYHQWRSGQRDAGIATNGELVDAYTDVYGPDHGETLWTIHNSVVYLQGAERLHEALAMAGRVVDSVERQQDWIGLASQTRQSLFSRWANTYKIKAQLHARVGEAELAFRTIELTKARTLLEATATRVARNAAIADPAEREQSERYERALETLNAEHARAVADPARRAQLDLERHRVSAELAAFNDRLAARYPRFAQLRALRLADSAQLRAALPPRTLFLDYSLEGVHVLVAAVSRERGLSVHHIGRVSALLVNLEAMARLLADPEGRDRPLWRDRFGWYQASYDKAREPLEPATFADLENHLAEKLLGPVAHLLRAHDHVVVSPDTALALVPIETLPLDGAPLIRRVDVGYAPSASVFVLSQARVQALRRERSRQGLLAVGGVDYEPEPAASATPSPPAPARTPDAQSASQAAAPMRELAHVAQRAAGRQRSLGPLPGSRREVEDAALRMKAQGARVLLGAQANKSALDALDHAGDLRRYRILLVSAHGVLDTEEPALSAIVLAPDAAGNRFVTAPDWMTYSLASDIVIASACETALGRRVNGEGVVGLPFAFQAAGSARALMTLWRVDDRATARFMAEYFAQLAAGVAPGRALRTVKLQFMQSATYRHPVYWAPFVLYGASDRLPR
jgi:CHAT domain-containing protein